MQALLNAWQENVMSDYTKYPSVNVRTGRELFEQLSARGEDINAVAKRDLTRYYDVLQHNLPTFTMQEALTLCACLNGVWCSPDALYNNVACSMELEANQFEIDTDKLLEAIDNLNWTQCQAVIDAVECAWNSNSSYRVYLRKGILLAGLAR